MQNKPSKKETKTLFRLVETRIRQKNYIFLNRALIRMNERRIDAHEILTVLKGQGGVVRKHNKSKDQYTEGYDDWNYCIEGKTLEGKAIRIIVTFTESLMPIITVIDLMESK